MRYVFRLGDRMKILSIPQLNVTDDKYHTIVVKRVGNRARLQIDYDGKVEGTTGGIHKLLNMGGGSFFTGGLPNVTEVGKVRLLILTISLPGVTDELFSDRCQYLSNCVPIPSKPIINPILSSFNC